jgi:hypothetical protein
MLTASSERERELLIHEFLLINNHPAISTIPRSTVDTPSPSSILILPKTWHILLARYAIRDTRYANHTLKAFPSFSSLNHRETSLSFFLLRSPSLASRSPPSLTNQLSAWFVWHAIHALIGIATKAGISFRSIPSEALNPITTGRAF